MSDSFHHATNHVDAAIDAAWAAFVDEDRAVVAPAALETRVLAAVAQRRRPIPPVRRRSGRLWLSLAAGLLAALALVWGRHPASERPRLEARAVDAAAITAAYPGPVEARPPSRRTAGTPAGSFAMARSPRAHRLPPPVMTLGAAPLHDTEPLQLARLRLPRERLQALGIPVLEPGAGGLVDIEVLVGEDGLARDIRFPRSGQE